MSQLHRLTQEEEAFQAILTQIEASRNFGLMMKVQVTRRLVSSQSPSFRFVDLYQDCSAFGTFYGVLAKKNFRRAGDLQLVPAGSDGQQTNAWIDSQVAQCVEHGVSGVVRKPKFASADRLDKSWFPSTVGRIDTSAGVYRADEKGARGTQNRYISVGEFVSAAIDHLP
jgi:hypothetical protein